MQGDTSKLTVNQGVSRRGRVGGQNLSIVKIPQITRIFGKKNFKTPSKISKYAPAVNLKEQLYKYHKEKQSITTKNIIKFMNNHFHDTQHAQNMKSRTLF